MIISSEKEGEKRSLEIEKTDAVCTGNILGFYSR